jgi:hypothetical protein
MLEFGKLYVIHWKVVLKGTRSLHPRVVAAVGEHFLLSPELVAKITFHFLTNIFRMFLL